VITRCDFLANSTLCIIVNVAVFISTTSCLFNLVRLFAGERLGKNPYACRDKARHHGFTTVNGADLSDDEDTKAISTSYLNWSKDEDDCLLAYVDHTCCVSNVTHTFYATSHLTSHSRIACHTSYTTCHALILFSLSYVEEMGQSQWTAGSIPKFNLPTPNSIAQPPLFTIIQFPF